MKHIHYTILLKRDPEIIIEEQTYYDDGENTRVVKTKKLTDPILKAIVETLATKLAHIDNDLRTLRQYNREVREQISAIYDRLKTKEKP